MYGMDDVDTFLEQAFGVTSEVMAENIIKQEYAVDLIAEKENLKVSDEEVQKKVWKNTQHSMVIQIPQSLKMLLERKK